MKRTIAAANQDAPVSTLGATDTLPALDVVESTKVSLSCHGSVGRRVCELFLPQYHSQFNPVIPPAVFVAQTFLGTKLTSIGSCQYVSSYEFDLDEVVPPDHLVRRIDAVLDLGWVHKELARYYSHTGRPSIDPVLMIRMLIVGYVFAPLGAAHLR